MNSRYEYKYTIEQCDILDKVKGEMFRTKRKQWMEWLKGEDPHAVIKQIYQMLWDYALFCSVNELRRLAAAEPEEGVGFNTPIL